MTSTPSSTSALVGGISLLLCSSITTFCAFVAEIDGSEPSLRGLVHSGVMILFAGICMEPTLTRSKHQDQLTDSQGLGLVFAGLGLFLLGVIALASAIVLNPNDGNHGPKLMVLASLLPMGLSYVTMAPVLTSTSTDKKSLSTLLLYLVASSLSISHTTQTYYPLSSLTLTIPIHTAILDAMAYVFHRAFIGSLLAGAGFGSSYQPSDTVASPEAQRQDLRSRYRGYFCVVALNLGLSWLLCEWESSSIISGILMLAAGTLQIPEWLAFQKRQFANRDCTWNILPPQITSLWSSSSCSPFVGYTFCISSFSFYTCTLFGYGVILSDNGKDGVDGCLTRAVHVAAVLAAMVAIFPRLLKPSLEAPTIHNVLVKGLVSFMSTVDVLICCFILYRTQETVTKTQVVALLLRMLGATLQAVSFALLQLRAPIPSQTIPNGELASKMDDTGSETSRDDSADQIPLVPIDGNANDGVVSKTTQDIATATNSATTHSYHNNRSNDGVALRAWMVYFAAHVWHSCVAPEFRNSNVVLAELQLSKIFHFQVITLGFYTTSIFRRDASSWSVVVIFCALEVAGIVGCREGDMGPRSLSKDRFAILIGSLVLLLAGIRQRVVLQHSHDQWVAVGLEKKDLAGNVLFPS